MGIPVEKSLLHNFPTAVVYIIHLMRVRSASVRREAPAFNSAVCLRGANPREQAEAWVWRRGDRDAISAAPLCSATASRLCVQFSKPNAGLGGDCLRLAVAGQAGPELPSLSGVSSGRESSGGLR